VHHGTREHLRTSTGNPAHCDSKGYLVLRR
jgi:hypothetical protein